MKCIGRMTPCTTYDSVACLSEMSPNVSFIVDVLICVATCWLWIVCFRQFNCFCVFLCARFMLQQSLLSGCRVVFYSLLLLQTVYRVLSEECLFVVVVCSRRFFHTLR